MRFKETKGHFPLMKAKTHEIHNEQSGVSRSGSDIDSKEGEKPFESVKVLPARDIQD